MSVFKYFLNAFLDRAFLFIKLISLHIQLLNILMPHGKYFSENMKGQKLVSEDGICSLYLIICTSSLFLYFVVCIEVN